MTVFKRMVASCGQGSTPCRHAYLFPGTGRRRRGLDGAAGLSLNASPVCDVRRESFENLMFLQKAPCMGAAGGLLLYTEFTNVACFPISKASQDWTVLNRIPLFWNRTTAERCRRSSWSGHLEYAFEVRCAVITLSQLLLHYSQA